MRPPFEGDDVVELLVQAGRGAFPDLRTIRGDVPRELSEVIHRLCARLPEDRTVTARAAIGALEPFVKSDRSEFEKNIQSATDSFRQLRSVRI